jgi:hypothetical protein
MVLDPENEMRGNGFDILRHVGRQYHNHPKSGFEFGLFHQREFGPRETVVPETRLWKPQQLTTPQQSLPDFMTEIVAAAGCPMHVGRERLLAKQSPMPSYESAFAEHLDDNTVEYKNPAPKGLVQPMLGLPPGLLQLSTQAQAAARVEFQLPSLLGNSHSDSGWQRSAPPAAHPCEEMSAANDITTLMICDIPCRLTIHQVIDAMDKGGYKNTYDLVYMPPRKGCRPHKQKQRNVGYAFVNFKNSECAASFAQAFHMFNFPSCTSTKLSYTRVAQYQGYEENLRMHSNQLLSGCLLTFQEGVVHDALTAQLAVSADTQEQVPTISQDSLREVRLAL